MALNVSCVVRQKGLKDGSGGSLVVPLCGIAWLSFVRKGSWSEDSGAARAIDATVTTDASS